MFGKKTAPPAPFDLKTKTFAELIALRYEIETLIEPMRQEAMEKLRHDMETLGVEPEDLKAPRKKREVPVKYRDPENLENTWSGMGKPKKWLQAYLDQGRTLEEFAVQ